MSQERALELLSDARAVLTAVTTSDEWRIAKQRAEELIEQAKREYYSDDIEDTIG